MQRAKFVNEVTVTDPDSKNPVELSIFKHENGGMFAIDSSYLDQNFDDDDVSPQIPDPFFIVYDDDRDMGVILNGL